MKMKRMLAVLAAISLLGTMGISAGAEDADAEIANAEEAVLEEDAVEEELPEEAGFLTVTVEGTVAATESCPIVKFDAPVTLNGGTNLYAYAEIHGSDVDDDGPADFNYAEGTRLQVTGSYVIGSVSTEGYGYLCLYDCTSFVVLDDTTTTTTEAVTTATTVATTTTLSETTTAATETSTDTDATETSTGTDATEDTDSSDETDSTAATEETETTTTIATVDEDTLSDQLYDVFDAYVSEKQKENKFVGDISSYVYVPEKQVAYGTYGWTGSHYGDILCIITLDGVTEEDMDHSAHGELHNRMIESYYFECKDMFFTISLVDLYSDGGNLYAVEVFNMESGTPVLTNLNGILIGDLITRGEGDSAYQVTDVDTFGDFEDYFSVGEDTLTINGVTYTYDTEQGVFVEVSSEDDETDEEESSGSNSSSGKTSSGSTSSSAKSYTNTSNTPKTGDATTFPAVAVGIGVTLTAIGAAAVVLYKKKK